MSGLLDIEKINKHFGGLHAVQNLSFTVHAARFSA